MELEQAIGNVTGSINEISSSFGRDVLHTLFPKEFELYMISLELVNPNSEIEEYFTFPINPNSISKTEPYTKSIERSFGKIIVNKNDSFTPQDLTIEGNFGRDFKVLVRQKGEITFNSLLSKSKFFQGMGSEDAEFNHTIKSGYGSFKILQHICKRSNETINGKPMTLYFHNFMLGESYLVEVLDFNGKQNLSSNMIWNYSLKMKIVAPINIPVKKFDFKPRSGVIQDGINKTLNRTKTILSSIL